LGFSDELRHPPEARRAQSELTFDLGRLARPVALKQKVRPRERFGGDLLLGEVKEKSRRFVRGFAV
jgi:hypothetical protein